MKVKCKNIKYEPGSYEQIQGVKGTSRGKLVGGKFYRKRGHGWGEHIQGSRLILIVDNRGQELEVQIGRDFKQLLGPLSKKRRETIVATMPDQIELKLQVSAKGTKYLVVADEDLLRWVGWVKDQLCKK
jgi:hypothetical protein